MAKKGIALALSMAMVMNMSPIELLQSYAEEMEQKPSITYVSQEEDTGNEEAAAQESSQNEEISTYAEEKTKTVSITNNIEVIGEEFGEIQGMDTNPIIMNSTFVEKGNYIKYWSYKSGDDAKTITVTPKRGYEWKLSTASDLSSIALLKTLSKTDNSVTFNHTKLDTSISGTVKITFSKKEDASDITTKVKGNGSVELVENQDVDINNLYTKVNNEDEQGYKGNTYTIEKDDKLKFFVIPEEGYEIKSISKEATIDEATGQAVVELGSEDKELVVEFAAIPQVKHDLKVNVTGNGSVNVAGEDIIQEDTVKLGENEEYTLKVTPEDDSYLSSIELDGQPLVADENGNYSISINKESLLEVKFAQRVEPEIVFEENALRVPWDDTEKTLSYKIVGKDGVTLDEGNVEFKETYTILGQTFERTIKPKDIGTYPFKVKYDGNEQHKSKEFEGVFEIYDNRKEVKIVIDESELTKVYNGQVQKPVAKLVNAETGEVIENADIEVKYENNISDILSTPGKDAGEYNFTATFKGDNNYSKVSTTGTMTIQKCKPSVKVSNSVVEYTGQKITTTVTTNPEVGYINVYTGVDLKLHGNVYIDLNLGDDYISKTIKSLIEQADIANAGDLKEVINTIQATPIVKDLIDVSDIQKALEYIPDDLAVKFGSPIDAGAYVSTAIVLDKNAEVAVGVGSLIIYRQNGQVIFTEDSLPNKSVIKYGDDYKFEAIYKDSDHSAKIMYAGITGKGKSYFSAEKPTEVGVYAAVAYSYDDPQYQTALAGRVFAINKETTTVEITSDLEKLYDGNPYEATSQVKDSEGNTIEDANVKYTYFKGCKKLDSAPTEVGKYTVVATYKCSDSHYASVDIKQITIKNAIEVVFDADNGTDIDKHRIGKGDVLDYTPQAPTKEGYTFVGWYKDTNDLTTEYASGKSYSESVTYKAKWAHMYSDKTLAQVTSSDYKSMTFTGRVYYDGDEIVERGILAIPTSLIPAGENLTLDTPSAAKFVMKSAMNPENVYGYYGGKINKISIKNSNRKMTGCTYVKYKTDKGQEYVVYSYNPEGAVSANDILNK